MAVILVVDDEANVLDVLQRLLLTAGNQVMAARTANEAKSLARATNPDVAVLDLKLKESNGLELFQELRARDPHMGGILLSGFLSVSITMDAVRLGFSDVLEKPAQAATLLAALNKAIGAARSARFRNPAKGSMRPTVRIAQLIVRLSNEPTDFRTSTEIARRIGVSRGSFRGWCRIINVKPKHVLAFARALRAHRYAATLHVPDRDLLDFADKRTLDRFLAHGGPTAMISLDEFCRTQTYVMHPVLIEAVIQLLRMSP